MKTKFLIAAATAALLGTTTSAAEKVVFLSDAGPLMIRLNVESDGKDLDAAWDDCIAKLHKYLDADGDGTVTVKEADRLPPTGILFGGGNPLGFRVAAVRVAGQPQQSAIDADNDGKVSRDELADHLRKNGGTPFRMENGPGPQTRQRLVIINGVGAGDSSSSAEAINAAVFARLDTDKDGKLSKEELAAADKVLASLDTDDDEMISLAELMPAAGGGGGQFIFMDAAAAAIALPPQVAQPSGPFVHLSAGQPGRELATRMLARYGGRDAKVLTRKQLGVTEEVFKALDRDASGDLDAAELARVADRDPDLELKVRIGKKDDKAAVVEIIGDGKKAAALGAKVTAEKDGTVVLEVGVNRVEMRLGRPDEGNANIRFVEDQELVQFKNADVDGNGYLDEKEAMANPLFSQSFKVMDRDGDGMLYEKEVKAYVAAIKDLQATAKAGTCVAASSDQGRGLFDLFDTRRDGKLSVRELRDSVKVLAKLDRDGDGLLAPTEVPKNFRMQFDQGGGSGTGFVSVVAFAPGMAPAPRVPELAEGPLWFRKWDRNRDGDVSRREFSGTDEEFRLIDTDGDGLISRDEAEKFTRQR